MICIGQCIGQDSIPDSIDSNTCVHGKVYKYFSNGNSKSFKTYEHGFLYGSYAKYYRNGQVKEKGFLDDVNEWTLLFRPSKVIKKKYRKNGKFKKSVEGEIKPINPVPHGKCQCEDENVQRIKSLLIGTWMKEKMIPFDNNDQIIDSVFSQYNTKITFLRNDSLSLSINGINHSGRYFLSSNTLKLEMKNNQDNWETLISMRWPKKTLYPNSKQEHFDLELIEMLNVLNKDEKVILSNVIIKFKKE
jgi:antitoxin component YwqK of YwqJK toxin-antitoxin module